MTTRIDVGIFAYNEQARIHSLITDLSKQDIFTRSDVDIKVYLLANGCTDATVEIAAETVAKLSNDVGVNFRVEDLDIKGKSRTWNHFTHKLSRPDAAFLLFLDGDIRIPDASHLSKMYSLIQQDPNKHVVNSYPIKDLSINGDKLSFFERKMLAFSGTSDDYKTAICGQMYLARRTAVENIYMPAGLPVEDGFLRGMILTDLLTQPEDMSRIDCDRDIAHIYESIRTAKELVHHQVRIVVGGAVNAALFGYISANSNSVAEARTLLESSADDENWLKSRLKACLPVRPYGYIPFSFATKRIKFMLNSRDNRTPQLVLRASMGFAFDVVIYMLASYRMARGKGAGFW